MAKKQTPSKLNPVAQAITPAPVVPPVVPPVAPTAPIVADTPPVHDTPPLFSYSQSGAMIARNEAGGSRLLDELGEHLTKEATTFELWESARLQFIAGAASVGYKAPSDLWDRIMVRGRAAGVIPDKPASTAVKAVKAQAERSAERVALEKACEGKTPMQVVAAATAAGAAGKINEATRLMALAKQRQGEIDKAAREKAADAIKPLHGRIMEALRRLEKAGDIKKLGMLASAAEKLSPAA